MALPSPINVFIIPSSESDSELWSKPLPAIADFIGRTNVKNVKQSTLKEVFLWGSEPKTNNLATWKLIKPGDVLLFYHKRRLIRISRAIVTCRRNKLGPKGIGWIDRDFSICELITKPIHIDVPIHRFVNYRRGSVIQHILRVSPDRLEQVTEGFGSILKYIRVITGVAFRDEAAISSELSADSADADELGFKTPEGKRKYVKQRRYERSPKLRRLVVKIQGVHCCVCKRSFSELYGPSISGYIEVHHITPLSQGERRRVPSDFNVLCANCHRAAHYRSQTPRSLATLKKLWKRFGSKVVK